MSTSTLNNISWFLLRFILLNGIVLVFVLIESVLYTILEGDLEQGIVFPLPLLLLTFFLTNLTYIVGNSLELLHNRMWRSGRTFKAIEKPFFKAGILMCTIVTISVSVVYFLLQLRLNSM